jgi:hypothetical protein
LARITPFLIKIEREGYNDVPKLLRQYQGMDADEIANEQDRRFVSNEKGMRLYNMNHLCRRIVVRKMVQWIVDISRCRAISTQK